MHALDSLERPVRVLADECLAILVELLLTSNAKHRVAAGSDEGTAASTRLAVKAPHDLILKILEPAILMLCEDNGQHFLSCLGLVRGQATYPSGL
jgi:hypothetical protein